MNDATLELTQTIAKRRDEFDALNLESGNHLNFDDELNFLAKLVNMKAHEFSKVTIGEIANTFMDVARVGLSINPAKMLAYLFVQCDYQSTQFQCYFGIGYRGYNKLAARSGEVISTIPELVYSNDTFIFKGTGQHVVHEITTLSTEKRGEFEGAYCTTVLKNGTVVTTQMSKEQIDEIEAYGVESGNEAWSGAFKDEMRKKTASRRHWKVLSEVLDSLEETNLYSNIVKLDQNDICSDISGAGY